MIDYTDFDGYDDLDDEEKLRLLRKTNIEWANMWLLRNEPLFQAAKRLVWAEFNGDKSLFWVHYAPQTRGSRAWPISTAEPKDMFRQTVEHAWSVHCDLAKFETTAPDCGQKIEGET